MIVSALFTNVFITEPGTEEVLSKCSLNKWVIRTSIVARWIYHIAYLQSWRSDCCVSLSLLALRQCCTWSWSLLLLAAYRLLITVWPGGSSTGGSLTLINYMKNLWNEVLEQERYVRPIVTWWFCVKTACKPCSNKHKDLEVTSYLVFKRCQ